MQLNRETDTVEGTSMGNIAITTLMALNLVSEMGKELEKVDPRMSLMNFDIENMTLVQIEEACVNSIDSDMPLGYHLLKANIPNTVRNIRNSMKASTSDMADPCDECPSKDECETMKQAPESEVKQ